jgi:hypothetical protein
MDDDRRLVADYVGEYDTVRPHSAIGNITPEHKLLGRAEAIFAERQHKLAAAAGQRAAAQQEQHHGAAA